MNKEKLDRANRLNNCIIELETAIESLSDSETTVTINIKNNKIFSSEYGLQLFYSLPEDIEKVKGKLIILLGQFQKEFKDLK